VKNKYETILACKFFIFCIIFSLFTKKTLLFVDSSSINADLPDVIVEGETVSITCTMNYNNGGLGYTVVPLAYTTWPDDNCVSDSQFSNSTYANSSASVVAQPPLLQTCTCTQRFNAPHQPPAGYATNAPAYINTLSSSSSAKVSCT
jgi:hypothetical protein